MRWLIDKLQVYVVWSISPKKKSFLKVLKRKRNLVSSFLKLKGLISIPKTMWVCSQQSSHAWRPRGPLPLKLLVLLLTSSFSCRKGKQEKKKITLHRLWKWKRNLPHHYEYILLAVGHKVWHCPNCLQRWSPTSQSGSTFVRKWGLNSSRNNSGMCSPVC